MPQAGGTATLATMGVAAASLNAHVMHAGATREGLK
jgi:hypothetical protein